jgi:Protein of unknown function, DUF488
VSYPGTRESVNFRGARKLCQIPRKSANFGAVVTPKNKAKATRATRKRAAPTKANSAVAKTPAAAESVTGAKTAAEATAAARLTVFTIGHSTRTIEDFLSILKAHGVERLVDVRSIPKSRRVPQFNSDALAASLRGQGVAYLHLKNLGGLRHAKRDSVNLGWRNASFRGYADYMASEEFRDGLQRLLQLANAKRTAIMCAEAVPWRCHRSLIGDALLVRGVNVEDIMSATSARPHEMTPFAKVSGLNVVYPAEFQQAKFPLS